MQKEVAKAAFLSQHFALGKLGSGSYTGGVELNEGIYADGFQLSGRIYVEESLPSSSVLTQAT